MSFIGVNPKRNERLDSLRKPRATLLGIPAPLPPTICLEPSTKDTQTASIVVMKELKQRLKEQGPRGNREAVFREAAEKLRALAHETMGTGQPPIMLQFGEALYSGFVQDLMSSDDLHAFNTVWRIRGCVPATIMASKEARSWTYDLVERHRMI